jgi:rod shape-determining protein MreD
VNGIAPDFFAIAVVFSGLILKSPRAMLIGFIGGLILDVEFGYPLGSNSFAYVWGAFLSAYFTKFEYWLGFNFTVIAVLNILIMRTLIIGVLLTGTDWSLASYFISNAIPETIYTFAFAGIVFIFFRDFIHEFASA